MLRTAFAELPPVKALLISAQIGIAEGVDVGASRSERRIVAGCRLELAVGLRPVSAAIGDVTRTIVQAGAEAVLLRSLD